MLHSCNLYVGFSFSEVSQAPLTWVILIEISIGIAIDLISKLIELELLFLGQMSVLRHVI